MDIYTRRWALGTVALAMLVVSLACGVPRTPPPADDTAATLDALQSTVDFMNAQTQAGDEAKTSPTQEVTPDTSNVRLEVTNSTGQSICYIFISPSASESWGKDWLSTEKILETGQTAVFEVAPGQYDLRADDCDRRTVEERNDVDLTADTAWTVGTSAAAGSGSGNQVTLTLVNDTSEPVCIVRIGVPNSEWIDDLLGANTIPGWGSYSVKIQPGIWTLQAEDCAGLVMQTEPAFDVTTSTEWHINPGAGGGWCGDGFCGPGETAKNCAQDCSGVAATCGNGVCDPGETVNNCTQDCSCGDGICDWFEDALNCPGDCFCGDGICEFGEDSTNCPQDCPGSGVFCGDGACDPGENGYNCEVDCAYCGDGMCNAYEDATTCAQDCVGPTGSCNDGVCGPGEDVYNCALDCGFCPDGLCTVFENPMNCPQDCAP